jgi:hypothetical protein
MTPAMTQAIIKRFAATEFFAHHAINPFTV